MSFSIRLRSLGSGRGRGKRGIFRRCVRSFRGGLVVILIREVGSRMLCCGSR